MLTFIFTFKKYIEKILHICLFTDRETRELICYSKNARKTPEEEINFKKKT